MASDASIDSAGDAFDAGVARDTASALEASDGRADDDATLDSAFDVVAGDEAMDAPWAPEAGDAATDAPSAPDAGDASPEDASAAVCAPGDTICWEDGGVNWRTCTANGTWGTAPTVCCAVSCTVGFCGSCGCTPGATQCSGNGVEICDATGTWRVAPCDGGSCDAGTAQCSGDAGLFE
jgi:hypothetical protein